MITMFSLMILYAFIIFGIREFIEVDIGDGDGLSIMFHFDRLLIYVISMSPALALCFIYSTQEQGDETRAQRVVFYP